jgi:AcrR family transcriptional regulator
MRYDSYVTAQTLTRRERVRLQTLDEIKQHAVEQVAEGGAAALSLNAIAKAMGMSGPAIYRYYASREELLAALVTDGYGELAAVVEAAAAAGARRTPERQLTHVADAYRDWALANPYRYQLLFSVRPEGYADPHEAIAAIEPAMQVLLKLIGAIAEKAGAAGPDGRLEAQLRRWAATRGAETPKDERPSAVLLLGVLTWTRLHGIIMLELAGVIGDMGLDAGLLVRAELAAVIATATGD